MIIPALQRLWHVNHVTLQSQSMLRKFGFKRSENRLAKTELRKLREIPGLLTVQTAEELLDAHTGLLTHLNELAGLSNEHYNRYYLTSIRHFALFVQRLPASEVHHHAGPGGMLTHTLEVCVAALKIRRSYLLSNTGAAEEIAAKQDLWTYAVFTAALCHDLAKVVVDQKVIIYDSQHQATTWQPWQYFMDEQGTGYKTEFIRNRQYRLHEKATPLLIHKILPVQGMNWLASDPIIFSQWLASISGDLDNACALGDIITQADGQSVATNLGADGSRMSSVKTIPLHEKMLTALRYLLLEGELPLNRNGAAGWITGDDCWLVSKRTVDAIREQLIKEGHSGIPSKNGRLFDVLQEHKVLMPCGDKAIWTASIEGEGWKNELTVIKIPVAKIWTNPERRPDPFDGKVIPVEQTANETVAESETRKEIEASAEIQSQSPATTVESELDTVLVPRDNQTAVINQSTKKAEPKVFSSTPQDMSKNTECPTTIEEQNNKQTENEDPVEQFFQWLQNGIKIGAIKTNQPKARVHVVEEGVALMTPGIFQDFAQAQLNDSSNWTDIQKKVLKKHWHVKDVKGLNVIKYQVTGVNKTTMVNVILFAEVARVFGPTSSPKNNPHLIKCN